MSVNRLLPSEQARFEKYKRKKFDRLKKIRILSGLNKMVCLASVLPFFYAAACLGQKKPLPALSKIGSVGFIACVAGAFVLREKEEKAVSDIQRLYERYHKTDCPEV